MNQATKKVKEDIKKMSKKDVQEMLRILATPVDSAVLAARQIDRQYGAQFYNQGR
jgi:hypothetical protein